MLCRLVSHIGIQIAPILQAKEKGPQADQFQGIDDKRPCND